MALFLGTDVINKKSPQDNLASCFYNHNELDLKNGFFGRKRSLSEPCTSTLSKRKKYVCKYQHFWEKEFTWLKKSDTGVGEDMAHCKLCNTNL
jgi:hypothetical protein